MSLKDLIKGFILDREEPFDTFILKYLNRLFILDEVAQFAFLRELPLFNFDSFGIYISE